MSLAGRQQGEEGGPCRKQGGRWIQSLLFLKAAKKQLKPTSLYVPWVLTRANLPSPQSPSPRS